MEADHLGAESSNPTSQKRFRDEGPFPRSGKAQAAQAAQAAGSANVDCVRVVNMTFLAARSAGCARTTDTGHRIVQGRGRRIETRGTESRRGEGG